MEFGFQWLFSDRITLVVSICKEYITFIAGEWSWFQNPDPFPHILLDVSIMIVFCM
jgi:hypothetical protein